jgi:hypothetical protein
MRKQIASVVLVAGLGLAVALGSTAKADDPAQATGGSGAAPMAPQSSSAQPSTEAPQSGMPSAAEAGQARIAELTAQLEDAYAQQFEQNAVDETALARMISDVVQAFPQPAQAKVKIHIDQVFEMGKKVASRMPPAERTKAVTPPAQEKLGKTQQSLLGGWGWGASRGFGGFGAFGWPASFYYAPSAFYSSYPAYGFYGTGLGCGGFGAWCGTGLGLGGWYW